MNPTPTPPPPRPARPVALPVLINTGLMLVLAIGAKGVASAGASEYSNTNDEAAFLLFFLLVGLLLLNGVALLIAAVTGKGRWVLGIVLSGLLITLVGLGTCGYSLQHMSVN